MAARSKVVFWTPEEDAIIWRHIKQTPKNLGAAFKRASSNLKGRTEGAVQQHYKRKLATEHTPHAEEIVKTPLVRARAVTISKTTLIKSMINNLNEAERLEIISAMLDQPLPVYEARS